MFITLDDIFDGELRLFAALQGLGGDDDIELYNYVYFLAFKKTSSKEYLELAILQAEEWVAVTPDGHAQRARRLELLDIHARELAPSAAPEHVYLDAVKLLPRANPRELEHNDKQHILATLCWIELYPRMHRRSKH